MLVSIYGQDISTRSKNKKGAKRVIKSHWTITRHVRLTETTSSDFRVIQWIITIWIHWFIYSSTCNFYQNLLQSNSKIILHESYCLTDSVDNVGFFFILVHDLTIFSKSSFKQECLNSYVNRTIINGLVNCHKIESTIVGILSLPPPKYLISSKILHLPIPQFCHL
jgi:hypothetical protein